MNRIKYERRWAALLAAVLLFATLMSALPTHTVSAAAADDGKIVITLDPGHGGRQSDDGSTGTGTAAAESFGGVNELYYNLAISLYTKSRLEQYPNVEVYLTRDNNEDCPGLKERADIATSHNSDALISIHNNSGGATTKGAEVIIPNQNYRSAIGTASKSCATMILNTLTAQTGLAKRTVYTKNSTSVTYPDGSVADHFQVIRNGKLQNIGVVMIVECGFLSNAEDYQNHFTTEAGLKRIGYAIADGITKYYNLTLKPNAVPNDPPMPTVPGIAPLKYWSSIDHVNGKGPNGSANFGGKGGNYIAGVDTIDAVSQGVTIDPSAKLSIGGWLGVDGGASRFAFSVDGGKTWKNASGGYDGEPVAGHYAALGLSNATKLGMFHKDVAPVVADLSDYAGRTVNVTFAAVAASDSSIVIPFVTVANYSVPGIAQPEETTAEPETTTEPESTTSDSGNTPSEPSTGAETMHASSSVSFKYLGHVDRINGVQYDLNGYRKNGSPNVAKPAIVSELSIGGDGRLVISGWALVNGGQDKYFWSVDGQNWYEFVGGTYSDTDSDHATHAYDDANVTVVDHENGFFKDIVADLSAYAGGSVNVYVAVRSKLVYKNVQHLCHFLTLENVAVDSNNAGPEETTELDESSSTEPETTELDESSSTEPETTELDEPSSAEPETTTAEPETTTAEPETTTAEPETATAEPETTTAEPETTTAEPETTTAEPETTTAEPETTTAEPETTTAEPETTTAEPETTTAEPETTTAEPETTMAEPETTTAEPETTTAEPETTTAEPETTTAEPETMTSQPETTELDEPSSAEPEETVSLTKRGCGASVSVLPVMVAFAIAAGLIRKKRE